MAFSLSFADIAVSAPVTDRAAIESAFAADCEAEAQRELQHSPIRFVPTTPDDGDEGSTAD